MKNKTLVQTARDEFLKLAEMHSKNVTELENRMMREAMDNGTELDELEVYAEFAGIHHDINKARKNVIGREAKTRRAA